MADKDGNIIAKDYGIGIKPPTQHLSLIHISEPTRRS